MRDAMSLPHLASPQVFRHIAPQYYSQVRPVPSWIVIVYKHSNTKCSIALDLDF